MHKVLVIEDDEAIRRIIINGLRNKGFNVLEASNAADGIDLARIRLPNLILCDLNMENGDGAVAIKRLREDSDTRHIPIILMTGQPTKASAFQAGAFRADAFLAKPFTFHSLLETIRACLRKKKENLPPELHTEGPIDSKGRKSPGRHATARPVNKQAPGNRSVKPSRGQLEALSERLQSLLEKERTQVARAIHDDLTQKLTVLAIELWKLDGSLDEPSEELSPGQLKESVKKLSRIANDVIQSAQRIAADLRPKVLDEFGLVAALEWFAGQFHKRTGIRCELCDGAADVDLDPTIAAEAYRLVQEILSNVEEHSGASYVGIRVEKRAGDLHLEVTDDGKGITAQQIVDHESLGLLAMRERMEHLGGEFSIAGQLGKGTTVVLHLPLNSS